MPLTIHINADTWNAASDARRHEWQSIMSQIILSNAFSHAGANRALYIHAHEHATQLDLINGDGTPAGTADIPRSALAPFIGEYIDIIRQLAREDIVQSRTRLEALDMAKKVVHDNAARTLLPLCSALRADHNVARRLFTLLLSMYTDTTRLTGIHSHRPVR